MNQVMISADSTCDLPVDLQRQRHVYCFALSILLGDTAYADGVEIRPADIYADVAENHRLPKTAAVPPGVYYDKFKQWTDAGYQNACTAAADLDNVYCIDSKNLCMGMGLLVLRACDLRDSGMDARRIAAKVSRLVPKVSSTFVLSDLEYLYKGIDPGGCRVHHFQSLWAGHAGGVLSAKIRAWLLLYYTKRNVRRHEVIVCA